jgi:hypothetical protein
MIHQFKKIDEIEIIQEDVSVGPPQFVAPDAQYASVLESVMDGV